MATGVTTPAADTALPVGEQPTLAAPPTRPPQTAATTQPATPRFNEKRDAILAAAARCFDAQGVRGATLADIAGSVGLATNSVTYYYRKKEDLASACLTRAIAAHATLASDAAAAPTVAARVQAFVQQSAQLLADMDSGLRAPLVSFNDIRALPPALAADVFADYTRMFRQVRDLLRGPETAALSRDDLNARGHIVLSVTLWLRHWLHAFDPADYSRTAGRVADLLLHGLRGSGPGAAWLPDGAPHDLPALSTGAEGSADAFLRAATVLVNEQGYRGASVDRIAAKVNLTKGSFYHHHDTKHDLISACFDRSFAAMRQALALAEDGAGAPSSGLGRACHAARLLVRHQLSADGPLLRATATSALPDAAQRARVQATLQRLTLRMAHLLVDGMVDGSVRPQDPAIAAQGLIGGINAAAELHRWLPAATVSTVDRLYVRPLFDGVLIGGVQADGA